MTFEWSRRSETVPKSTALWAVPGREGVDQVVKVHQRRPSGREKHLTGQPLDRGLISAAQRTGRDSWYGRGRGFNPRPRFR